MTRKNSIVTLSNGNTCCEKQCTSLLSLRERVYLRRRVTHIAKAGKHVLVYPRWDFDGPDIQYFGKWQRKEGALDSYTFRAGHWILDGRQLVADAKDRIVQMIEACMHSVTLPTKVHILPPVTKQYTTLKGWDMGNHVWNAFWSGVRKGADVAHRYGITLVAVCANDPYEQFRLHSDCRVEHVAELPSDAAVTAISQDPFSFLFAPSELEILYANSISLESYFVMLTQATCKQSSLVTEERNPLWKPNEKLDLLHT